MFGKAISNLMIKPGLAPVFDSPENHGLNYEDVTFKAEDGVTLSGWLIKGGTDKVIVPGQNGHEPRPFPQGGLNQRRSPTNSFTTRPFENMWKTT